MRRGRAAVICRLVVAAIVASSLCACSHTNHPSSVGVKDRAISASVPIDSAHKLALTVRMDRRPAATPGLTPLEIDVRDVRNRIVSDSIVFVQVDSTTGETPKLTIIATRERDAYRAELPLVYGSHWSFAVKAYSAGRNATLAVEEQLD